MGQTPPAGAGLEAACSGSCICIYLNDYESVCQYIIKLSASLSLFFMKPKLFLFLESCDKSRKLRKRRTQKPGNSTRERLSDSARLSAGSKKVKMRGFLGV